MPDSYGKRQRNVQKARKLAAREERRAARKRERTDRATEGSAEEPYGQPQQIGAVDPSREADRHSDEPASS